MLTKLIRNIKMLIKKVFKERHHKNNYLDLVILHAISHFVDSEKVIIKISHFAEFEQAIIKISHFAAFEQVIIKISHFADCELTAKLLWEKPDAHAFFCLGHTRFYECIGIQFFSSLTCDLRNAMSRQRSHTHVWLTGCHATPEVTYTHMWLTGRHATPEVTYYYPTPHPLIHPLSHPSLFRGLSPGF